MNNLNLPVVCILGSAENPCFLVRNGTRKRKPKIRGGFPAPEMRAERFLCKKHKHSLSLPPKVLLPHIHYMADVVEDCVKDRLYFRKSPYLHGIKKRSPEPRNLPHPRTIHRWVKRLGISFEKVRGKTARVLGERWVGILDDIENWLDGQLQRFWELLWLLASESKEDRSNYFYVMARSP